MENIAEMQLNTDHGREKSSQIVRLTYKITLNI